MHVTSTSACIPPGAAAETNNIRAGASHMGRTRFLFTVSLHQAELYFQSDHAFGTRSDPGGETLVRSGAVAYAVQNGLRIACGVHASMNRTPRSCGAIELTAPAERESEITTPSNGAPLRSMSVTMAGEKAAGLLGSMSL